MLSFFKKLVKKLVKKKCWHAWDVYVHKELICGGIYTHTRKTKICRTCSERRIKERAW